MVDAVANQPDFVNLSDENPLTQALAILKEMKQSKDVARVISLLETLL